MTFPKLQRSVGICLLLLAGCVGTPKGVKPVRDFALDRYLGTWYEIARFDHSFEKGLQQVTAEYTLREDGGINVLNRGFNVIEGKWENAEGKAYFVDDTNIGHLKVSFFGPFFNSYVVFELGDDYGYSFVTGPDKDYLWLLARKPQISAKLYQRFTKRIAELGYDPSQLIRVDHQTIH